MARNILVVEDDNNISDLIRMYLEKEGFEVRIAADGGKAVEEFKAREPDLVLLDVMLPVIDGWGVCAKIRADLASAPSSCSPPRARPTTRSTASKMGADDYLVKPFEMKELHRAHQRRAPPHGDRRGRRKSVSCSISSSSTLTPTS